MKSATLPTSRNGAATTPGATAAGTGAKTTQPEPAVERVLITPPRFKRIRLHLVGSTPLMILRFSEKAQNQIIETQKAGSQAKSKKKREPKNFERNCEEAKYIGQDKSGKKWCGINASSFRNAAISMCRLVNFKMTMAKLSIFIVAEGYDVFDRTPLVKIISDAEPEMTIKPVRNASGVMDLRARPEWSQWECYVTVRFDEDQFSTTDVVNLFARVGAQGGIGEGRPNSKEGNGMENGLFEVVLDG